MSYTSLSVFVCGFINWHGRVQDILATCGCKNVSRFFGTVLCIFTVKIDGTVDGNFLQLYQNYPAKDT